MRLPITQRDSLTVRHFSLCRGIFSFRRQGEIHLSSKLWCLASHGSEFFVSPGFSVSNMRSLAFLNCSAAYAQILSCRPLLPTSLFNTAFEL